MQARGTAAFNVGLSDPSPAAVGRPAVDRAADQRPAQ